MSQFLWGRLLTFEEDKYFRKKGIGHKADSLKSLAVMGPADHPYVSHLNIETKSYRVYLDDGQYIDEATSRPEATGGKRIEVQWGIDSAYNHLLSVAEEFRIQILYEAFDPKVIYFESVYLDRMLESFRAIDSSLYKWYHERPFFTRLFGATYPDNNSKEFKTIQNKVRTLLK